MISRVAEVTWRRDADETFSFNPVKFYATSAVALRQECAVPEWLVFACARIVRERGGFGIATRSWENSMASEFSLQVGNAVKGKGVPPNRRSQRVWLVPAVTGSPVQVREVEGQRA